jgi:uncharacterized membrane protein
MKGNQSYMKYFFFGAMFGLMVTCAVPKSTADYIGHGTSNIFIYGAVGYSIYAFKNKEYKKLWNVLLFLFLAFILPIIVLSVVRILIF